MAQRIKRTHYDVVVVGGGAAGVAAAVGAARNGARTLLVEAGPLCGGELLSGIGIAGCINARGEWIVGGVARELFGECDKYGGFVGAFNEWRLNWLVCCDPEIMKISVVNVLRRYGVKVLLYSFAEDVIVEDGRVAGVIVLNKSQRTLVSADIFIDCSGDGDVAMMAGAPFEVGGVDGELQPVSMVFRMAGLDNEALFAFIRDHPENIVIGDNPHYPSDKRTCIENLITQGFPRVFFDGKGPLIKQAIDDGEMYPTALISVCPVSTLRKEVSCNSTRIAGVDATETDLLSATLPDLMDQVWTCARFLVTRVPGFENANFAGVAPRIGIRETRRITGEYVLTGEDCQEGRKFENGIAKGCHHIDIHQAGSGQVRIPVKNGGSYDVPYPTLIPRGLKNVFVAGRCMSADREGHGTARVLGTVMGMGQAAGTAAAMCVQSNRFDDVRDVPVQTLRAKLKEQGCVVDGTH